MGVTRKFLTKLRKRLRDKVYQEKNKETLRVKDAQRYQRNKEKVCARARRYRQEHLTEIREYDRLRNAERRIKNAAYYRAKTVQRRNRLATKPEDLEPIKFLYEIAQMNLLEVDHIIPLQGETVCGLNTPRNLQLIPAELNRIKYNKFNNDTYQLWRLSGEIGPYLAL